MRQRGGVLRQERGPFEPLWRLDARVQLREGAEQVSDRAEARVRLNEVGDFRQDCVQRAQLQRLLAQESIEWFSSPTATARAWLDALGYLTEEQIDTAVAYTQEEGAPAALLEMDADDFETMVEEMELGDDDDARFRVAVRAIADEDDAAQPSPCARLLGMVEETTKPADGQDGAEVVASLKQEIAASQQETLRVRERLKEREKEIAESQQENAKLVEQMVELQRRADFVRVG